MAAGGTGTGGTGGGAPAPAGAPGTTAATTPAPRELKTGVRKTSPKALMQVPSVFKSTP